MAAWHRASGPLVVLHRQDVIATALTIALAIPAMTMQRVRRDDAALQLKKLDELQSAGRFVVFPGARNIGERPSGSSSSTPSPITGGM